MKIFFLFFLLPGFIAGVGADTLFVANLGANTITEYAEDGSASAFTNAFVNGPNGVALDRNGNLFVSTNSNTIEKFSPTGADLGIFASVGVNNAMGLAFDRAGNLYVANFAGSTVEKFTPGGVGTIFAFVTRPTGLVFDATGNLYVSSFGNTIERFAPNGTSLGFFAQSGLNNPEGLAFDSLGNLYAANNGSGAVEKFSPSGADLGPVLVGLNGPVGLAFDSKGNLYVVNSHSATITKIDPNRNVSTFATTGFAPAFLAVQTAPHLVNISTRARVLTGDNVLDAGFILTGPGSKQVLIRALGPSLADAGVHGVLADPTLELHDSNGALIAANDNWKQSQRSAIEATGIPPTTDAEAALLATLTAGSYTAIERGKSGSVGIGLVEIYDLGAGFGPQLANISTRGFVDTGDNVMIAGFIIGASTGSSGSVIVRALGPSLGQHGVADPLANPSLELYDSNGMQIAANDDWQSAQGEAIAQTGLAPDDAVESAILTALAAGSYTAIERGDNGSVGVGLLEVYDLP
ncbi:MAG TPA: NHL repeat-containing protein [Chthoniobacterales bacterium]